MTVPPLSVVMAVNRGNPFLQHAIRSVLEQTDADFEFLIGANACSDALIEDLRQFSGADPRVVIHRTNVPQLAHALNMLADHARGGWLVRMDADDLCEPQRLARLRSAMRDQDADVIGSWATLIDEHDRVIGHLKPPLTAAAVRRRMLVKNPMCHPTVAMRRAFWLRMRGYVGGLVTEDFDLWLRGLDQGARIVNIPEPLLRYRMHSAQVSRSRLGYAETAAIWCRQALLHPSAYHLTGFAAALLKAVVMPMVHAVRRAGRTQ